MIKSTKTTLKFANTGKLTDVHRFIAEYRNVMRQFVDLIWTEDNLPPLLDKKYTSQIRSWLSQRAIQCAGKQASALVRGTKAKQNRRLFMVGKLNKQGNFKQARKLKAAYLKYRATKPDIAVIEPELDSRFVRIDLTNATAFDGWITLTCLGDKIKIQIPFKKHKHFNEMLDKGKIKNGIRLSTDRITFMFDLPEPEQREQGKILGLDIGQKTTLSCSDGQVIGTDNHGHTYQSICQRLARKVKGSEAFDRTQKHRSNYLRWCCNQLDLSNVKQVNLENIKYLRQGCRTRRTLSHWNYAELFGVLESKLGDAGVQIAKLNPTYTSQRCSACGWVCKSNRKAKRFRCVKCGYVADADLNASVNLSLDLIPLGYQKHLSRDNRAGFYWALAGQESIVPDALQA